MALGSRSSSFWLAVSSCQTSVTSTLDHQPLKKEFLPPIKNRGQVDSIVRSTGTLDLLDHFHRPGPSFSGQNTKFGRFGDVAG